MADLQQRREEILRELRSEAGRERVIQRLKALMGLRPDQALPNETPIVTTLIRLEQQSRQPSRQS